MRLLICHFTENPQKHPPLEFWDGFGSVPGRFLLRELQSPLHQSSLTEAAASHCRSAREAEAAGTQGSRGRGDPGKPRQLPPSNKSKVFCTGRAAFWSQDVAEALGQQGKSGIEERSWTENKCAWGWFSQDPGETCRGGPGARAWWIQEATCSEDALALFQHPSLLQKICSSIPMVKQQPGSFPRSDVSLCKGARDAQHVLGIWRWEPLGNEPCFPLIATFSKKIVLSVLIKKKKKEKINITYLRVLKIQI